MIGPRAKRWVATPCNTMTWCHHMIIWGWRSSHRDNALHKHYNWLSIVYTDQWHVLWFDSRFTFSVQIFCCYDSISYRGLSLQIALYCTKGNSWYLRSFRYQSSETILIGIPRVLMLQSHFWLGEWWTYPASRLILWSLRNTTVRVTLSQMISVLTNWSSDTSDASIRVLMYQLTETCTSIILSGDPFGEGCRRFMESRHDVVHDLFQIEWKWNSRYRIWSDNGDFFLCPQCRDIHFVTMFSELRSHFFVIPSFAFVSIRTSFRSDRIIFQIRTSPTSLRDRQNDMSIFDLLTGHRFALCRVVKIISKARISSWHTRRVLCPSDVSHWVTKTLSDSSSSMNRFRHSSSKMKVVSSFSILS